MGHLGASGVFSLMHLMDTQTTIHTFELEEMLWGLFSRLH